MEKLDAKDLPEGRELMMMMRSEENSLLVYNFSLSILHWASDLELY